MAIEKYKTKSGLRYRAVAYVDGQKVQKRGFKTKREAQKWIDHARVDGTLQSNITFAGAGSRMAGSVQRHRRAVLVWQNRDYRQSCRG